MTKHLIVILAAVAAPWLSAYASDAESPALRNPSLSVEQRAADIVAHMTLKEKAQQLGNDAPAIPRLGIPAYNWWSEGLHGVARAGIATVFPQAIGMAASWDTGLLHESADIIGTEFRAKYVASLHPDGGSEWYRGLTVWSPNINIFRDPRWGRGQETYGEDPYLTSRMGVAFIRGLQGNDANYFKTIATSKHYAVHSGPESNRHKEDVFVSPHDLNDTYLPAFRATVIEGHVQSVMCSYNSIDGIPGCANDKLMNQYLRKSWGFDGYVVSDCGAAANVFRADAHHFAPDAATGVAISFRAGMDLICGDYRNNMSTEVDGIIEAVKRGLLPESVIDRALQRLFAARIRLGMFDPPGHDPYATIKATDNDTPAHHAVALRMAQESMVLLRNEGHLLPLKKAPARIAVIGPNATNISALLGNYNGTPSHPVTVLDGIRKRFKNSRVTYVEGTGLVGPVLSTVPPSALCVDQACKTAGLKAEYFNVKTDGGVFGAINMKVDDVAALVRNEREVDFTYGANDRHLAPTPLKQDYLVRWTGLLKAPESGEYQLGFLGQGGFRVWVDGKQVADDWVFHDTVGTQTTAMQLEKGHTYSIRIEYFQIGPNSEGRLLWNLPSQHGEDAVAAARSADVVIFVAGLSPRVEGEEMKVHAEGFSGGDRTSIALPAPQQQLLERISATGKPVVLVLMNGSALGINWADQHVPAIVDAWYPGGEGGTAVAQLLAGDFSPAGRLPVTFYKSVDQLPAFNDYSMSNRTYRYFNGQPLYPFGYGLSYTTFAYSNARVSNDSIAANGEVKVSVDVTNSGSMDGDEVVQLYVDHPGVKGAPLRSLEGFQRVHLNKGEKRTVEFVLRDRALSVVDDAGKHQIVPGNVDVWIGGGQPLAHADVGTPGQHVAFKVTTAATLAD
ncbi:MAG TPA: glycoside hydrolase family 3 C-terminal domain-containing protein [Steroidobacteraceae bacterium]|nr:glycoside hydrolase family 3 C-terminal domain-containing protein [Steroidobacteraceae bacterium]